MKLILENFNKMNSSIYKVCINGLKFCFILMLLSCFVLVQYHTILNPNLFYIGMSLAKSTLFFISFFIICAFAIDFIRKDLKK